MSVFNAPSPSTAYWALILSVCADFDTLLTTYFFSYLFFCVLYLRQTDLEHWVVLAFCIDECMVIPLWMLALQHFFISDYAYFASVWIIYLLIW